jgi:hypothetical protein
MTSKQGHIEDFMKERLNHNEVNVSSHWAILMKIMKHYIVTHFVGKGVYPEETMRK